MTPFVTVVGGGLAGCEAAWQLARLGHQVRLVEMKPKERTPAQVSNHLAELVCSNSLRSSNPQNAVGLLKEEMGRLHSLVIAAAYKARVPAGDALAVDREQFACAVQGALGAEANIEIVSQLVTELPKKEAGPHIIATGPLTAAALAASIAAATGRERLYFYDAIAPIISGDSIDRSVAFLASRYDKGDSADYLNCPLDKEQYQHLVSALLAAECMPLHAFEEPKYFQGCLPIEVVAESGHDALRYGCMKPVGLTDPRTGKRPYAVVQLRKEDTDGQAWNMVGFQTKLKWPEQRRIFRTLPGLAQAELLRLGAIHRNTYIDSPALLDERLRLVGQPHLRFAGQITGVEGYVESAACGLLVALLLHGDLAGSPMPPPPLESALGALYGHIRGLSRLPGRPFEPQNVNWSMFPPAPAGTKKNATREVRLERARAALLAWALESRLHLAPCGFAAA